MFNFAIKNIVFGNGKRNFAFRVTAYPVCDLLII